MRNDLENDKIIKDLFLDLKSQKLISEHKTEYAKYLTKQKYRFYFIISLLTLSILSIGTYSFLKYKKDSREIQSNKQLEMIEVDDKTIARNIEKSCQKDPKSTFTSENKIKPKKIGLSKNVNSPDKIIPVEIKKTNKDIDPKNSNIGEKSCNKKFEDFGLNVIEKDVNNSLIYNVIALDKTGSNIKNLKINGESFKLPVEGLSYGKYLFEITDKNNCKYIKILKINQLSWEETE